MTINRVSGQGSWSPVPQPQSMGSVESNKPGLLSAFLEKNSLKEAPPALLEGLKKMEGGAQKFFDGLSKGKQLSELHQIAENAIKDIGHIKETCSPHHKKEIFEFSALIENRIMFEVGSKTIDLLFSGDEPLKDIIQKFYRDESHPMDLQRYFRDPEKSVQVGNVLNNLSKILVNQKINSLISGESLSDFNKFLDEYIEAVFNRNVDNPKNLVGVKTVIPAVQSIREGQTSYFLTTGISNDEIDSELTFSTPKKMEGILLLKKGQVISKMGEKRMFQDKKYSYLRVPDASNRIVRISNKGYSSLEKLAKKNVSDLGSVVFRLKGIFQIKGHHIISYRTKSATSILDKCGRLSAMTQGRDVPKYRSVCDIIDVSGCRITCADSREIYSVIQELRTAGFQFFELDNKYSAIRKDGAYKVVPCTIKDPESGLVFELQITSLTSTTVTDLFHNVIYKREAIGLGATKKQELTILRAQRLAALIETANFEGQSRVHLTKKLDKNALQEAEKLLDSMLSSVNEYRRLSRRFRR